MLFKHFPSKAALYAEILAESPDCANSLAQQVVSPRAKAAAIALARIPADAPNHDRREWREIKVPTLVLASHRDPIHPFEFGEILAREIPGAEFRELTPKSTSLERYAEESQRYIGEFLQNHFSAIESSGASVPEKSKLC